MSNKTAVNGVDSSHKESRPFFIFLQVRHFYVSSRDAGRCEGAVLEVLS